MAGESATQGTQTRTSTTATALGGEGGGSGGASTSGTSGPGSPPAGSQTTTQTTQGNQADVVALKQDAAATSGQQTQGAGAGTQGTALGGGEQGTKDGAGDGKTTAPAPLELKVPDTFKADDPLLSSFKEVASKAGLKSEQAQAVLDAYAADVKRLVAEHEQSQQAEQKTWAAALRSDPDIGGAKYDANVKSAAAAVRQFGGPELAKFMNESGMGNNPTMVKAWVRVARALGEDSSAGQGQGAASPPAPLTEQQMLDIRYPSMKKAAN